jgi:sigma-E factor negative regulatory protein RseA
MKSEDPPVTDTSSTLRQRLSALADGEAAGAEADAACRAWRDDAEARRTWHAYQLIGDVMRSDELARPATADAAFLSRLRERLADEPVVLAPEPLPAASVAVAGPDRARSGMPRWLLPSAVAAGFVAVAGVLVVTRLSAPETGAPVLAQGAARTAPGVVPASATSPLAAGGVTGLPMLRDPQLDAYLQAHQATRGRGALAVPGGMLRSANVELPEGAGR